MINKTMMAVAIGLALSGCEDGGNGSSSSSVAIGSGNGSSSSSVAIGSGQFKDSNTSGISYESGGKSGVTNENGDFSYEIGKEITFSVGNVVLGKSIGKALISPVDLVVGGNSDTLAVKYIASFLMMLDTDQDATNGITISTNVQDIAFNWPQIKFTARHFTRALKGIIPQVNDANEGISHSLPTADIAKRHLEKTLRCAHAGAYYGNYTGANNGNLAFMISADNGNVTGLSYSVPGNELTELSNNTAINHGQQVSFAAENSSKQVIFESQFDSLQNVSGDWTDTINNLSGAFSVTRMGGAIDTTYRYTGRYIGDEHGMYSIDLDSSNKLTGVAYNIKTNQLWTISGNHSGEDFIATSSSGANISGTLNTATGALSGNWSNSTISYSGTFTGSGCQLN
ncbi:MAG: hypothetical protein MJK10_01570 [Pseudomonadales bacterium]|nr:hypothetical protein [Pseudomonadales bacterium]NRA14557.1 hypothetical protein [Oceanospirillaceae bacterium]